MLAAAMLLPFASQAQTSWTVADGTTTHALVPLDFYNCDGSGNRQAQMLYPASLLTEMDGATIGTVKLYHQNTGSKTVTASTWYLRMGETSEADLSSGFSSETLTTVYSGNLVITEGVMTFELTTPYTYNGGNLIVEIQTSGATGNWFGSGSQGCYGVDNAGSTYSTMSTPNHTAFVPKITFTEVPSCFPVNDLAIDATQTTSSSLTLTWTDANNSGASYDIYTVTPTDTTLLGSSTTTTYTATGLDANTAYVFGVASNCGGGDLAEMRTVSGRTACNATTPLPYSENFGGYTGLPSSPYTGPSVLPACWDYYGNGTNTAETTGSSYFGGVAQYNYTSSYACLVANDPYLCMPIQVTGSAVTSQTYIDYEAARGNTRYAVLPAFPTALNTLQISFDYKMNSAYSATGTATTLELGYITTDTSSFVSLQQYQAVSSVQHVFELSLATLAAAAPADARLAFKFSGVHNGTGSYSYSTVYCGLDNIVVEELPSCFHITDLVVSGVTSSSLTLTWSDAVNTGATYSVYTVTPSDTTLVQGGISNTTYTVENLDPNTQYVFSVVANCSASDASEGEMISGRTACIAMTIDANNLFSESFEGTAFPPDCWSTAHTDIASGRTDVWQRQTSTSDVHTGSASAKLPDMQTGNKANLVTPLFDIDAPNAYVISFWMKRVSSSKPNEGVKVWVNTTPDTIGGTPLMHIRRGFAMGEITETEAGWYKYSAAIPTSGEVYIIFEGISEYGNYSSIDDIAIEVAPDCLPVTGLAVSNIGTDGATLTWSGIADGYTIYNMADTTVYQYAPDTTVELYALDPATQYTFGVVANCGSDESDTMFISFRTACATVVVDADNSLHETFNSLTAGIPACWDNSEGTTSSDSYKWSYYATGHEGAGLRFDSYYNSSNNTNFLATPPIQLDIDARLSFWYKNPTAGDFSVLVSTDGGTTRTTIASGLTGASDWTLFTYDFDADTYTGETVIVYFKGTSNYGSGDAYIYLDDVTVGQQPSCLAVTNLAVVATETTSESITLSWVSDGSNFTVLNMADTTEIGTTTDTFMVVNNLTPNTVYTFGVLVNCGGETSDTMIVSGRTACAAIATLPYTMGFEDSELLGTANNADLFPSCWTRINTLASGTYTYYPYAYNYGTPINGSRHLYFYAYSYGTYADTTGFIMPELDVNTYPMNGNRVTFWAKVSSTTPYTVLVGTMTNPADRSTFTLVESVNVATTTATKYTVNLTTASATDAYVAFIVPKVNSTMYIDDVTLEVLPSCGDITGLTVTGATAESITLTWAEVEGVDGYTVYDMADNSVLGTTTGDTTFTVENLTANTAYTFGVKSNCSGGDGVIATISGRTACTAFALPYTEDFENGIDCWSRVDCESGTTVQTDNPYSGTHAFKFYWNTNPPQYLISPEFTGGEDGVEVSFMYRVAGSYTESFVLGYSTTTNDVASFTWLSEQTGLTNTTYASYTDYLPAGTKYVAVKYTANDQLGLYIDSMVFSPMAAGFCFPVAGLTVDSTTGSSVTLSWTGDAASYSIYNGTTYVGSTTDTFYTVSGLTASTAYTFGVTAVCSATDSADMVTVSATTGCAGESCLITISGTDAYNDGWDGAMITVSQNGVTVGTFTVDAASNTATYSVCSGAPVTFSWTTSTYYEPYPEDISFTITDGGGATVHSLTDATNMTDGVFFTLADACPSCVAPVVTLDSVNTTTATISWTSTATSFNVYNGTTAVATGISANTYTFTGLTAGTAYTFGVEAICGAGDTSAIATVNAQTEFDCSDITTLPYLETFEAGALGCWTTVNSSTDPTAQPWQAFNATSMQNGTAHSGIYVASAWSWNGNAMNSNTWMISPKFVLPTVAAGDTLLLSWWELVSANYPDSYSVELSTTTNDVAAFTTNLRPLSQGAGTWTLRTVDLTAYAGQSIYVAFHHVDYDNNYLFIDDISMSVGAAPVPAPDTLNVTIAVANATMGTTNPVPGTYQYITGDTVRINAVPNAGYHFVGWEYTYGTDVDTVGDEYISISFPANIFMSYGSVTFTALFEAGNPDSTTITYAVNDATMGSINPAGTQTIYVGNTIQAEATANAGYELYAWVLDILVNGVSANRDTIFSDEEDFANPMIFGTLPQFVVDSGATITITALFQASTVADTYTVTVNVNNAAMGSVTGAPTAPVAENTVVTLTAVANTGYRFVNWSNGLTNETISITVVSDTTLTANFEAIPTYTVTTVVNPANSGSITGAPTTAVLEGSEVVLTAVPAAGYHFVNWSNGSTTATIQVTVTSDTTLTANFEANAVGTYTVAVNYDATMGTVTGIPTEAVTSGTEVTLTATANTGFHFVSWSTGATTETITITVTSDTVLSATFEADEAELFTITVSSADETMGTVTGGGQFHAGDQTTVMAVANDGYRFVRWSDGNTEAVRQITVTGDLTLVAYFESIDGIDDVEAGNVSIYSAESRIFVKGAENSTIYVYDVNGRVVRTQANATETVEFTVPGTGVYLVKVGNAPAKRVVVVR